MRDYLYLNMDFLESFVAQQDNGLSFLRILEEAASATEVEGSESTTNELTLQGGIKEGVSGKASAFGFLEADAKGETTTDTSRRTSNTSAPTFDINTQTAKEIILQKQRENIFDKFLRFMKLEDEHSYHCSENVDLTKFINRFVGIRGRFDYTSISRLDSLTEAKMQDFYSNYPNKKFEMNEVQELRKQLPYIKTLLPFDCFLHSSGCMIFIEDEYHLRKAINQIGYKFRGDDIIIVGKVCKCVGEERRESASTNQLLDGIQVLALDILVDVGVIKKPKTPEICLISPVAIWTQI